MKILKRPKYSYILGLLVFDGLFFGLTNPTKSASVFLILGFLLVVANLYLLVRGLMAVSGWYGLSFGKHTLRTASVITGVIGGIVALQSMGQLTPRDVMVLLPFAVLTYLYSSYNQTPAEL